MYPLEQESSSGAPCDDGSPRTRPSYSNENSGRCCRFPYSAAVARREICCSILVFVPHASRIVRRRFAELRQETGAFSPRHLILLAHQLSVSEEALCRRLEELNLLPAGTWDSLRDRGFSGELVRRVWEIGPLRRKAPFRRASGISQEKHTVAAYYLKVRSPECSRLIGWN